MPNRKDLVNAIRFLAVDAIDKANSGHPGAPMGMAEIAQALWSNYFKHNPNNPDWINRDRFVLSNGHASALYYSLLHLYGYDMSLEEIKNFRQFGSKTPGHPEHELTKGVDVSTGPLGQGIATAVGLAIAEKNMAAIFNKPNYKIIDHNTYVLIGDGCLMEGISYEACSLAGTLGLSKLVVLYDSNNISIDGTIENWFNEDVSARFKAMHWNVIDNVDGQNSEEVDKAIAQALAQNEKPSFIICKTTIGYGSPNKANLSACHGSPLGIEETKQAKSNLAWNYEPFTIPQEIYTSLDAKQKGLKLEQEWQNLFANYAKEYPELAKEFLRRAQNKLPENFANIKKELIKIGLENKEDIAIRKASQKTLEYLVKHLPELTGGSGDLSPSNLTINKNSIAINKYDFAGNYLHYGVREFAMATTMNGLALNSGYIPYGGTFLVFSDYLKSAIRSAALMHLKVIYVLTHDTIGVGEDGPTHQPIEQIPALRLIPNVELWRPATYLETIIAYLEALTYQNPSIMALAKQNLPNLEAKEEHIEGIKKGGYIMLDCAKKPEIILISCGSELHLAYEATKELQSKNIQARLVAMPNLNRFYKQDMGYQNTILPKDVRKRVAIEAANGDIWYKLVGLDGLAIDMQTFGKSAPAEKLFDYFGFNKKNIMEKIQTIL